MNEFEYELGAFDRSVDVYASKDRKPRNADGLTEEQARWLIELRSSFTKETFIYIGMTQQFPATLAEPEPVKRLERTGEWRVPVSGEYFEDTTGRPFLCTAEQFETGRWILRKVVSDGAAK